MAWLNQKIRQRLLGAFVLTALAVIFLPMLLTREQEPVQVQVEVPDMPNIPAMPEIQIETITVPELPTVDDDIDIVLNKPMLADDESDAVKGSVVNEEDNDPLAAKVTDTPVPPTTAKTSESPTKPATKQTPAPANANQPPVRRLDTASLPISWSVQLASLKNHSNAEKLRDDLRRKGYNAYIRPEDGMSKVLVGPLIDLNSANRLRSELEIKQRLKGFVVRFQP